MGSPVTSGTWDGFQGAFYTGVGNGELLWLLATMVLLIVAVVLGARHEQEAYEAVENK